MGQLWEPCPRCQREPVCSDCGYCQCHCGCEQDEADRQEVAAFEKHYPGLLDQYGRHLEDGGQEQ